MLFNSLDFLIFLPIVVLLYFLLPKKIKNFWLLLASYYFYMCWNAKYALLIFFSTAVTYGCGLAMERIKRTEWEQKKKKAWKITVLVTSLVLNLAVLVFFKYTGYALHLVQRFFWATNISLTVPAIDVLLPVGISFYTFQALSYTMDVYRDDIYAEKNFIQYALFVSFFPQLVAGPIERSKNLLKQLAEPKKFSAKNAQEGILLMIWGFFLKLVIADRAAIFVDSVYGDYAAKGGWLIVVATLLFAVQIYCDFYGYSVIAKGTAKILGIDLMENFQAPYMATSVSEFWRRWHISLTSWFKDYLYIPLGGSRKGKFRKQLNKMIVFLVSGLWHGAQISFVVWGALNGLYQIVGDGLKPIRDKIAKALRLNRETIGHRLLQRATTFLLICFSWIFFRADGITESINIIKTMIQVKNPWIFIDGSLYACGLDQKNFNCLLICIGILVFADYFKYKNVAIHKVVEKQSYWFRWLAIAASVIAILVFGIWGPAYDASNFVYFQF